jgi:hypothetical protein
LLKRLGESRSWACSLSVSRARVRDSNSR